MASSDQLNKYMLKHKDEIKDDLTWLGVYASNTLPSISNRLKNSCLISNYDPDYKGGSHWIGIRLDDKKKLAYFFDSYGNAPDKDDSLVKDKTEFRVFLKQCANTFGYKIQWNKKDFQNLYTDVCGLYAAYFCINGAPEENPQAWNKLHGFSPDIIRAGQIIPDQGTASGKLNNDKTIRKLVDINVPVLDSGVFSQSVTRQNRDIPLGFN